ncbi:hypothetical protein SAMN02927921_03720 [Sinomicrobium oceani]|uniref:Uncharacterized protein n=1 Tax=Sinomicrobium oceani TaxID=1150368 RepID=A0A1K1RM47_9FLAO|nr:hypothetical protein SAMN02927921_03720 [Sinomicrobium oceani]
MFFSFVSDVYLVSIGYRAKVNPKSFKLNEYSVNKILYKCFVSVMYAPGAKSVSQNVIFVENYRKWAESV